MDPIRQKITLYTVQTDAVLAVIDRDGVCFNREACIREKYGFVSEDFLLPYRQFIRQASALLPPPEGAEYPYWAFENPALLYVGPGAHVLKLSVPADQVLLFDAREWNRILQHQYLGINEADRQRFDRELERRGITVWDAIGKPFFPDLRRQILSSWNVLLRHHDALLHGSREEVSDVQAALWQLRREWITEDRS